MSSNTFSGKRFALLWKQHFIQNTNLLLLGGGAYIGVIFIILTIAQIGNEMAPHDLEMFRGFLLAFVGIFGVMYVGHAFPAFRSKERTINYLMVPASSIEKFLFEFISRLGIIFILMPILYWITFHMHGYILSLFTTEMFKPIGVGFLNDTGLWEVDHLAVIASLLIAATLFGFVLAFTGAAMFQKQPLIKTLFSLAMIIVFFSSFMYIAIEPLGVGRYNPPEDMWLLPRNELSALKFITYMLVVGNLIMLFVAYRKLIEREV